MNTPKGLTSRLRLGAVQASGEEGMADVRIIEAIYKSAQPGKTIKLPAVIKKQQPTLAQEIRRPAHGKPPTTGVESPSGEAA